MNGFFLTTGASAVGIEFYFTEDTENRKFTTKVAKFTKKRIVMSPSFKRLERLERALAYSIDPACPVGEVRGMSYTSGSLDAKN
jgi:hypothetical protein